MLLREPIWLPVTDLKLSRDLKLLLLPLSRLLFWDVLLSRLIVDLAPSGCYAGLAQIGVGEDAW